MTITFKCRFDVQTSFTFRAGIFVATMYMLRVVFGLYGGGALIRKSPGFLGRLNATMGYSGIAERNLL